MSDVPVIDMVDALPAMRQGTTPFRSLLNGILAPAALPPILGLARQSGHMQICLTPAIDSAQYLAVRGLGH